MVESDVRAAMVSASVGLYPRTVIVREAVDETELTIGMGLRRSIDHGLAHSRFGIVVMSHTFFAKEWPQRELDGLVALQVAGRQRVLLVWQGGPQSACPRWRTKGTRPIRGPGSAGPRTGRRGRRCRRRSK